jgi:hypothetical protein
MRKRCGYNDGMAAISLQACKPIGDLHNVSGLLILCRHQAATSAIDQKLLRYFYAGTARIVSVFTRPVA